jgi:hypothetical protein
LIDAALAALRNGYVFPCWPAKKNPITPNGEKSASNDPERVRAWWTKYPAANIGVVPGLSGHVVMDADHFRDEADFRDWYARREWPATLIVRTGRRGEFGVHIYFRGTAATGVWSLDGASGHIRGDSGYVLAPGSVHDVSGERYEVLDDNPIAEAPAAIQTLRKPTRKAQEIADPVADAHLGWLLSYLEHHSIATRTDAIRITGGWKVGVHCPWQEHSEGNETSTVTSIINGRVGFMCSHETCQSRGRNTKAFKKEMYRRTGAYRREPGDIIVKL